MQSSATSVEDYLREIPPERKEAFDRLREAVRDNIPPGFHECMSYGMIGYVVPHTLYPSGYHCDPKLPLPFVSIANQKNNLAFYHMGIYADERLLDWFVAEYARRSPVKLDMGKSCVRFKKLEAIPFDLIGELSSKTSVQDWIALYETKIKS